MCQNRCVVYFVILVTAAIQGCYCLRLTSINVPDHVTIGQSLWLKCTFDLEGEELYDIKWFKDGNEIYRYVPTHRPPTMRFRFPGVYVDLSKSRRGDVFLRKTDARSEGLYRCEITTTGPMLHKVEGHQFLDVTLLARSKPKIQDVIRSCKVGDIIELECTTTPSDPPAQITWKVNGRDSSELTRKSVDFNDNEGIPRSRFRFEVSSSMYQEGRGEIKVTCISTVSGGVMSLSRDLILEEWTLDPLNEQPQSGAHGADVDGGVRHHNIDDMIDVNCSSTEVPVEGLRWYINNKEAPPASVWKLPATTTRSGRTRATLRLLFMASEEDFENNNVMRLSCRVTAPTLSHRRTDEVSCPS